MSKTRGRTLSLLLFEGLLAYGCALAACWLRFGAETVWVMNEESGWSKLVTVALTVLATFYFFDLYDSFLIQQPGLLVLRVAQALGMAAIVLALAFYLAPQLMLGRGILLLSFVLMLFLLTGWRLFARWLLGHPKMAERVLILGTERSAVELAREVLARRESGYEIVGFVGNDPQLIGQSLINPRVVGLMEELEDVARQQRADRIVVALDDRRGRLPLDQLLQLKLRDAMMIEDSSSFYERLTGKVSTEQLRPSGLIFSVNVNQSRPAWRTNLARRGRRLFDLVLAAIGLTLASPLMLLTAIAIKLDSRGPLFYTQERVGLHNRSFRIIKFRSMRPDAEKDGAVWARERDPRVTRVGRVIRKLRIDELPQFINVLRGEMSMIGPRPERPFFVAQLEQEIPYYSQRHLVKPGITGWAQICYPYGASLADAREKLQYDLYYIKNQSLVLNAIILLETARIVLFGRLAR